MYSRCSILGLTLSMAIAVAGFAPVNALAAGPPRRVAVLWLESPTLEAKELGAIAQTVRDTMRWRVKDTGNMRNAIGIGKANSISRYLSKDGSCSPRDDGCAREVARALSATHFVLGSVYRAGRSLEMTFVVERTDGRNGDDDERTLKFTGRAPTMKLLQEEAVRVAGRMLKRLVRTRVESEVDNRRSARETPRAVARRPKREMRRTLALPKRSRVLHYDKPSTAGELFVDGDYLVFKSHPDSPFHELIRVPLWRVKRVYHAVGIGTIGLTIVDDDSMFAEIYYFGEHRDRDPFESKLNALIEASKAKRAREKRR